MVVAGLLQGCAGAGAERRFAAHGVVGSFALLGPGSHVPRMVCLGDDPLERTIPASTFKLPNLLLGLELGVVTPETNFHWDGTPRTMKRWERDLTLAEALQVSCVPCFQEVARGIGLARMRSGLQALGYGDADPGLAVDRFWLDGPLSISVVEQVAFVRRLADGVLPFKAEHLAFVREAMHLEDGPGYRLFAKTGWGDAPEPDVGWFVGWVEVAGQRWAFATRLRLPGTQAEALLPLRREVTLELLHELGVTR
jgi:beta-lactamase class D